MSLHVKRITNSKVLPSVGCKFVTYIIITTYKVIINLVHFQMVHFAVVETLKKAISLK